MSTSAFSSLSSSIAILSVNAANGHIDSKVPVDFPKLSRVDQQGDIEVRSQPQPFSSPHKGR
jgi:hypothetical protein